MIIKIYVRSIESFDKVRKRRAWGKTKVEIGCSRQMDMIMKIQNKDDKKLAVLQKGHTNTQL